MSSVPSSAPWLVLGNTWSRRLGSCFFFFVATLNCVQLSFSRPETWVFGMHVSDMVLAAGRPV